MTLLSLPAKEAIKTGLSMSIACGIAMGLGWSNPYWACITVAVVSLPTMGESINKCLQRLCGTLFVGGVGLSIIGLFPQERWAFITCLSLFMGFSAYRMTISRRPYFWFISGYVTILVAANVELGSQRAFYTALIRLQETGIGVIVYSLVSVLIWPQHCADELYRGIKSLIGVQTKIFNHYFPLMLHSPETGSAENWYSLEAQLVGQLGRRLDAVETEQFEIHEVRGWWRLLISHCQALMEAMEVWREGFPELQSLDLEALLPGLPEVRRGLRLRFRQLDDLLEQGGGQPAEAQLHLDVDQDQLQALPHLQRAAVCSTIRALEQIDEITRALVQCVQAIKTPRRGRPAPPPKTAPAVSRPADADSYATAVWLISGIWLSSLVWILIDVPGHISFVVLVGVNSLVGLSAPQMNWVKFFWFNARGVALATLIYVFVLPNISGYFELSLVLFITTTAIYAIFWHPRKTMLKLGGIVPIIMLTGLQPIQTYDFASFANNAIGMLLSILFAGATSCIPFCKRPEKMFLRVTARYFRQARQCLSLFAPAEGVPRREAPLRLALAAMQASVGKIGGWANSIDYRALTANPPEKAAGLVTSLTTITYRFKMLAEAEDVPQPLWPHLRANAEAWRLAIAALLGDWSGGRFRAEAETGGAALRQRLARLEAMFEETFAAIPAGFAPDAYANAYRLLGGYRGLYQALVAHAARSEGFDWDNWRETRF